MAEELQQLLEKIQRDGVDKANAEAAAIVAKAKAEADALVKKAQEAAAAAEAKGKADADAYAARARETIAQAARDTVLKVKDDVTKLLTKLLAQDVPKWECDLLYPTGGEIVIKGKGKSFTVKEEPQ